MTVDRQEALEALRYLDPGVSRKDWLLIAIAAKAAGIDFDDFNDWSAPADNYGGTRDTRDAWKDVVPGGDIGPTRIFHMARQAGWTPLRTDLSAQDGRRSTTTSTTGSAARRGSPGPARASDNRRASSGTKDDPEKIKKDLENEQRSREKMTAILARAQPARVGHPYLSRKQIKPDGLLTIRLADLVKILGYHPEASKRGALEGETILVAPFHAGDGKPVSLEFIDGDGRKCAMFALPRGGMMWGTLPPRPALIGIAEGIATAKSVAPAAGCPTVAAGSVNNMGKVLLALQQLHPQADFIFFADLGKSETETARVASEHFCPCIAPDPSRVGEDGSDFNDMELASSQQDVADWINSRRYPKNEISWALARQPVEIDYVLPSLPAGSVGLIAGPGAVGKTYFALDLCVSIALGESLSGLPEGFRLPKPGRTAIVLGEDPPDIIHNRLCAMAESLKIDEDRRHRLTNNMKLLSMAGEDMRMIAVEFNVVSEGPFTRRLESLCRGRRLAIVDPLIRLHDGPENDNNVANKLMLHIQRIARDTGCAILLLHHVGKGSGDNWQAARGASAYTTSVRWQMNMLPPSDEEIARYGLDQAGFNPRSYVRCAGVKMNYGSYVEEFWLGRVGGGVLMHTDMSDKTKTTGNGFDTGGFPAPRGQALGARIRGGSPYGGGDGFDDDDLP